MSMAFNWTGSTEEDHGISTASMPAPTPNINTSVWYKFIVAWLFGTCIMVIPGNLVTIVAYFKFKALHNGTNILICSQSVMDFFIGLSTPVIVYFKSSQTGLKIMMRSKYTCLLMLWIISFSHLASLMNIMAISLERLVAVRFPFAYINPRKKQTVLTGIIVAWFILILCLSLPILGWNQWSKGIQCAVYSVYTATYLTYFILIPVFSFLCFTAIIDLIIMFSVRKRHTRVSDKQTAVKPNTQFADNQPSYSTNTPNALVTMTNNLPVMNMRSKLKITLMLLNVAGVFFLCWMPYIVCTIIVLASPSHSTHSEMAIVHEFSKGLMILNGFFNPFIYATQNKTFRAAFMKLLFCSQEK